MAVDLEVAFSTHQTIYVVFGLLFIVVFLLQICVEGNLSEPMSHQNIKWQLHRLGLFATLLFLVYSLDPYTANGLYTPVIVYLLSVNISSTIISALTVVNHASTAVVYKSQFRPTPAWFTAFSWIAGLGTFVVGNIVGITADRKSAGWITAVFMLWYAQQTNTNNNGLCAMDGWSTNTVSVFGAFVQDGAHCQPLGDHYGPVAYGHI